MSIPKPQTEGLPPLEEDIDTQENKELHLEIEEDIDQDIDNQNPMLDDEPQV